MDQQIFFQTTPNSLPQITLIGHSILPSPFCHPYRTPTEYILFIICEGRMLLKENDMEYVLNVGDMILLDPSRSHIGCKLNSPVHYIYIHFKWDNLSEIAMDQNQHLQIIENRRIKTLSKSNSPEMPDPLYIPKFCHISEGILSKALMFCSEIITLYNDISDYHNLLANCELLKLLTLVNTLQADEILGKSHLHTHLIIQIASYLRNNFDKKISSDLIEKNFNRNFDYLNRRFKAETGQTIFQFLKNHRIEESKVMLKAHFYTNAQIAEKIGFCNEFYFSSVFKNCTGTTPLEYKNLL